MGINSSPIVASADIDAWDIGVRATSWTEGLNYGVVPVPTAADGSRWLNLPNLNSKASQTVTDTVNGQQYQVDFSYSVLRVNGDLDDFSIEFTVNVDGGASEFSFTGNESDFVTNQAGNEVPSVSLGSFVFTADNDGTLLEIESLVDSETDDQGLIVDNLTITPIPEPSSAALLGLGGLALILRRRK